MGSPGRALRSFWANWATRGVWTSKRYTRSCRIMHLMYSTLRRMGAGPCGWHALARVTCVTRVAGVARVTCDFFHPVIPAFTKQLGCSNEALLSVPSLKKKKRREALQILGVLKISAEIVAKKMIGAEFHHNKSLWACFLLCDVSWDAVSCVTCHTCHTCHMCQVMKKISIAFSNVNKCGTKLLVDFKSMKHGPSRHPTIAVPQLDRTDGVPAGHVLHDASTALAHLYTVFRPDLRHRRPQRLAATDNLNSSGQPGEFNGINLGA